MVLPNLVLGKMMGRESLLALNLQDGTWNFSLLYANLLLAVDESVGIESVS